MKLLLSFLSLTLLVSANAAASKMEIVLQASDILRQANAHIESGDTMRAKKLLQRALKGDLTSTQRANAHNGLCVALLKEEAWYLAMDQCDQAIRMMPTNWRYYNNRGNVYFGLGEWKEAMEDYMRGLRFAPKSTTLAKNIALLKRQRGFQAIDVSPGGGFSDR